jgi:hypothetical protein
MYITGTRWFLKWTIGNDPADTSLKEDQLIHLLNAERRGAEWPNAEWPNAEGPNAEWPNAEWPNAEWPNTEWPNTERQ